MQSRRSTESQFKHSSSSSVIHLYLNTAFEACVNVTTSHHWKNTKHSSINIPSSSVAFLYGSKEDLNQMRQRLVEGPVSDFVKWWLIKIKGCPG